MFNFTLYYDFSMFLLMKGKSKDEAFKIGQEIADTVTKMFPKPIKLKFEKVCTHTQTTQQETY